MNFHYMKEALAHYRATWASGLYKYPGFDASEERDFTDKFTSFLELHPKNYTREDLPGHFTGGALVTNKQFNKVLLTHHAKLNLWLHLGGHADGDPLLYQVAMREAHEESGLSAISFPSFPECSMMVDGIAVPAPFDIDCHAIAPRKTEPAHFHYDVRYIVVGDENANVLVSHESFDVKWFSLDEARKITDEHSMHRQFAKLAWLAHH